LNALKLGMAAVSMALHAVLAHATYVVTRVDYPGALTTDVRGINNDGRIAGYASFDNVTDFGFTYRDGVFTPLPPMPFVAGAFAHGINDAGAVTGGTEEASGGRGFVLTAAGYHFFSKPLWLNTTGRAISNSGLVTGYADDGAGTLSGFIYDPATGVFTDVDIPGSTFTIVQGMNAAGQVVGSAVIPGSGANGFLRQPDGSITLFKVAGLNTRARGINDTGLMTGGILGADGTMHAFAATSAGYQLIDAAGSTFTFGQAINNRGWVSGGFIDTATDSFHGFIAMPASMPTGTTAAGAFTFAVDVVANVPIVIDPPVAVGYDYAIGKKDPAIAAVRLPIGIGDSLYLLVVQGKRFTLGGGTLFDFRAHGFARGVKSFRVACIEASAGLDVANSQAFPTELTFVGSGRFTGTQRPLSDPRSGRTLCERETIGDHEDDGGDVGDD
jgi:hypothetical protein